MKMLTINNSPQQMDPYDIHVEMSHLYRDVYRIESIVSYGYHKTDTGIV